MNGFDLYNFILCTVTFLLVAGMFGVLIGCVFHQGIRLIRLGAEDEEIKKEYFADRSKSGRFRWLERLVSLVTFLLLLAAFLLSVCVNLCHSGLRDQLPMLRAVASNSMSAKYEKNTYLTEHGLDDQFARFDLIITHPIPAEEELELYDVVVYDFEGVPVIHRIVDIEEPNESHPGQRRFTLQGDNEPWPDRKPVRYDQMQGIYTGQCVKYVGSLVFFLQSIAGWLCIALMLFTMAIIPVLEKKIEKEKRARLIVCGVLTDGERADTAASR